MKKIMSLLLCMLTLFSIAGCKKTESYTNPVTFYYLGNDLSYDAQASAIQGETREGAGMVTLENMLTLYLQGPESEELSSPFPAFLLFSVIPGPRQKVTQNTVCLSADSWKVTLNDECSRVGLESSFFLFFSFSFFFCLP